MVTSVIELYEHLEAERGLVRELREELRRDDGQTRGSEIRDGFVEIGRRQAYQGALGYNRSVDSYSDGIEPIGFGAWCDRVINRAAVPSFISYDEFREEFSRELAKEYSDRLAIYRESVGQKEEVEG